jgi:hypothetical protein
MDYFRYTLQTTFSYRSTIFSQVASVVLDWEMMIVRTNTQGRFRLHWWPVCESLGMEWHMFSGSTQNVAHDNSISASTVLRFFLLFFLCMFCVTCLNKAFRSDSSEPGVIVTLRITA